MLLYQRHPLKAYEWYDVPCYCTCPYWLQQKTCEAAKTIFIQKLYPWSYLHWCTVCIESCLAIKIIIGRVESLSPTPSQLTKRNPYASQADLKVLSGHSNLGAWLCSFDSGIRNWRPGKFFICFNHKASREEHKTIYSGLRISGMALSNQSDLPVCFSPWKVNLKIRHCILLNPAIPEEDLPRLA